MEGIFPQHICTEIECMIERIVLIIIREVALQFPHPVLASRCCYLMP